MESTLTNSDCVARRPFRGRSHGVIHETNLLEEDFYQSSCIDMLWKLVSPQYLHVNIRIQNTRATCMFISSTSTIVGQDPFKVEMVQDSILMERIVRYHVWGAE